MIRKDIIDQFCVSPGGRVRLRDHDPGWAQTEEMKDLGKDARKERARRTLDQNLADLATAQDLLYADDRHAVLIVFQAMDAAGKDGTVILKFFLNVSKGKQKRRFLERLDRPEKNWKFSEADLAERGCWDRDMHAYSAYLLATSTAWAPWYVVPADHKRVTRAVVADVVTTAIRSLDLKYPEVTDAQRARLAKARQRLLAES